MSVTAEEKVPHVLPLQLELAADQFTPALSLVAAVMEKTCVTASVAWAGETATEAYMFSLAQNKAVWGRRPESVTLKPSGLALAPVVGVPIILPDAVSKDRPEGKAPLVSDHL